MILRAGYTSGYRAPQAYDEDLHVNAVGGNVSLIVLDPDLKPEYSNSFTLSADLYRNTGKVQLTCWPNGSTRASTTYSFSKSGRPTRKAT